MFQNRCINKRISLVVFSSRQIFPRAWQMWMRLNPTMWRRWLKCELKKASPRLLLVMFKLKIIFLAYLINISASNKADDVVQFVFKEYTYKETSKNVSFMKIHQKSIKYWNFRIFTKLFFVCIFVVFDFLRFFGWHFIIFLVIWYQISK